MTMSAHIPEHRLELSKRGAQSNFWHGRCACGWSYPGVFTTTQATVRASHKRHIDALKVGCGVSAFKVGDHALVIGNTNPLYVSLVGTEVVVDAVIEESEWGLVYSVWSDTVAEITSALGFAELFALPRHLMRLGPRADWVVDEAKVLAGIKHEADEK